MVGRIDGWGVLGKAVSPEVSKSGTSGETLLICGLLHEQQEPVLEHQVDLGDALVPAGPRLGVLEVEVPGGSEAQGGDGDVGV